MGEGRKDGPSFRRKQIRTDSSSDTGITSALTFRFAPPKNGQKLGVRLLDDFLW